MTGKQRLLAVMAESRPDDFPVVIPYLGIFQRDHWDELTDLPWWELSDGNVEKTIELKRSIACKLGIDWVCATLCPTREWRESHRVEVRGERVFLVDTASGEDRELTRPRVGGAQTVKTKSSVQTEEDIERNVTIETAESLAETGQADGLSAAAEAFGDGHFVFAAVAAPFWGLHSLFGFYEMMTNLVERPALVEKALEGLTERNLEYIKAYAQAGLDGVWLEDCYSSADLISLDHFRRFAAPYVKRQIGLMNELGLKSVYYFCGDVSDRLDDLIEMDPTCISLEESKKGFEIDVAEVDRRVDGRACIFGNLDAITLLPNASNAELRGEIERQIEIGRRHGRFVSSLGSPVTPETTTARVREFVELARESSGAC